MARYALRRVLAALPLIWFVWTLTFLVGHLAPGDPLSLYESARVSPAAMSRLRQVYGLDDPLPVQYLKQMAATATGDLAISTSQGRPVSQIIGEAIGPTLLLASLALLLQFGGGLVLGMIAATTRHRFVDHAITAGSLFVYSMPSFWLGVELILLFSYHLGWLPSSHMHSVYAADASTSVWLFDLGLHLILPLLTLGLGGIAATARHMRSSMLEVLDSEFVRTARARGLPEWRVVARHALRNALLPLVTLLGLSLPFLLSGAIVVEVIFSWPGLGQVAYNAIRARDFPLIQATTLLTTVMVIAGSLLADLLAATVDPRVRLGDRSR